MSDDEQCEENEDMTKNELEVWCTNNRDIEYYEYPKQNKDEDNNDDEDQDDNGEEAYQEPPSNCYDKEVDTPHIMKDIFENAIKTTKTEEYKFFVYKMFLYYLNRDHGSSSKVTRETYEQAIKLFKHNELLARELCLNYAQMEFNNNYPENARIIYKYCCQFVSDIDDVNFWMNWQNMEQCKGTEQTRQLLNEWKTNASNWKKIGNDNKLLLPLEEITFNSEKAATETAKQLDLDSNSVCNEPARKKAMTNQPQLKEIESLQSAMAQKLDQEERSQSQTNCNIQGSSVIDIQIHNNFTSMDNENLVINKMQESQQDSFQLFDNSFPTQCSSQISMNIELNNNKEIGVSNICSPPVTSSVEAIKLNSLDCSAKTESQVFQSHNSIFGSIPQPNKSNLCPIFSHLIPSFFRCSMNEIPPTFAFSDTSSKSPFFFGQTSSPSPAMFLNNNKTEDFHRPFSLNFATKENSTSSSSLPSPNIVNTQSHFSKQISLNSESKMSSCLQTVKLYRATSS